MSPDGRAPHPIYVCQIISSFRPLVGGAERALECLCRELADLGVRVVVLTRRYPGLARRERVGGVDVHRLGFPSRGKLGAIGFAAGVLWQLATRLRAYRIVHVQNPDTPLFVGLVAKLLLRRRLFATLHTDPQLLIEKRGTSARIRLKLMSRLADTVGALSEEIESRLEGQGFPRSRLELLPNGIDVSLYQPPTAEARQAARSGLGLSDGLVVYLFVGRLAPVKRVDTLLRAWSRLASDGPRALLIVGDGREREKLESLSASLGLRDVEFVGAADDVLRYLQAADVFVLPSEREGQSVALLEAMATGLAPIVSDAPGNVSLVDDRVNGLVFPVGDEEALADRLMAAASGPLRERLGARAALRVRQESSIRERAETHRQLYAAAHAHA